MKIYVKIKALAKKRPIVDRAPLYIEDEINTINELVASIVRTNVREYNTKEVDKPLFPYLLSEDIEEGAALGKVGFQDRKNENTQDEEEAVRNALECFKDGLFRLFINDDEVEYDESVQLNENDELTFIRLAMLAGRLF